MTVLPPSVMERIRNRAEEAYPEECCGFLTGYVEGAEKGAIDGAGGIAGAPTTVRVLEEVPARNAAAEEDRRREFLVEPKDLLKVMKRYRDRDEDVVGFYHSHPDHEAELSPTDLKFARLWPSTVWLVVPVKGSENSEGEREGSTGSQGREGNEGNEGSEGLAGSAGREGNARLAGAAIAGEARAWWLSAGSGNPGNPPDTAVELDNVQEMTIRSSANAERAITPREERA